MPLQGSAAKFRKMDSRAFVDVALIGGAWFSLLLSFVVLGRLGYGTGLQVATMGEDQNWVALLNLAKASETAQSFWKIDGRNPLSPWFYIAVRPIILHFGSGLALVQQVVSLLLGVATYALLTLLLGRNGRLFAVTASTIVAVNQANAYFDHIIWNFQLALCFSILSVASYILFLRTKRQGILYFSLALCCWCLAFQTYTLQSGAIVAIASCQLFYLGAVAWKARYAYRELSVALITRRFPVLFDLLPFALTYVLFLLVWITTSPGGGAIPYAFSFKRFLASLQAGMLHEDVLLFYKVALISPSVIAYACVAVGLACVIMLLIAKFSSETKEVAPIRYGAVVAIVLSLALPTILIEAGGAAWPPGSRWRMIYEFTTPVMMLCIAGLVLSVFRPRLRRILTLFFSFILLSISLVFSLVYNERQLALTRSEAMVRKSMSEAISERRTIEDDLKPLFFILELDDSFEWLASESLRSVYMRTWFPGRNVEYRVLPSKRYLLPNPTRLTFSEQGLKAAGSDATFPFARVVLLHGSGKSVTRRSSISRDEVIAHNGNWELSRESVELR